MNKPRCEHDWNDTFVFEGEGMEHAVAVCDLCGRVAFEHGHTPNKPVYCSHVVAENNKQGESEK